MSQTRRRIICTLAFLFVLSLFSYAAFLEFQGTVEADKRTLSDRVQILNVQLHSVFYTNYYACRGITAYLETHPSASNTEENQYISKLFDSPDTTFRNVTIIQGTTITNAFPLESNKAAIGKDLAQIPAQRETILAVRDTKKTVLTGPVDLVQGGKGIIVRTPVMIPNSQGVSTYWGQVSFVLSFDELIASVGIPELSRKYQLQIIEKSPAHVQDILVWDTSKSALDDPIASELDLPGSTWIIKAEPLTGWGQMSTGLVFMILFGFLLAVLSASYLNTVILQNIHLEEIVRERTFQLTQTNEYLEDSVSEMEVQQAELTLVNDQLEDSLKELKETQEQLIISEKLASLGELVAGVAHEINTPLGIGVTLSTFIDQRIREMRSLCETDNLSKADLDDYLHSTEEAAELSVRNLRRAADIIETFKQVAVDQSALDIRKINLADYIRKILMNLSPKLKGTRHEILTDCDDSINVITYPGVLAQIFTNLIMNSLIHGFDGISNGTIHIRACRRESFIDFVYTDNGVGIAPENLDKVFNPFFSTKRSFGSSGLGLHIVHNLITQTLKGSIRLRSTPHYGVEFRISFPETSLLEDHTE